MYHIPEWGEKCDPYLFAGDVGSVLLSIICSCLPAILSPVSVHQLQQSPYYNLRKVNPVSGCSAGKVLLMIY